MRGECRAINDAVHDEERVHARLVPARKRAAIHRSTIAPSIPTYGGLIGALIEVGEEGMLQHQRGELVHPDVLTAHQLQAALGHLAHPADVDVVHEGDDHLKP